MSNPIKHHFVPQCYLKKFSLDNKSVNYYDKVLHLCDNENIEELCQIPNFYKLSQSDPYYIETNFFANKNENKLARILAYFETIGIDLDKIPYDKEHRINLSRQIVLQYMRTPLYRDTKSENELTAYYKLLKQILNAYNIEVEKIEFIANNKAEFHKTILLENEIIDDIIEGIANANWELLYTSSGEFYTSDNPIAVIARNDMPVTYCDAIKYFSELYYPLNSRLILHVKAEQPNSCKNKKIEKRLCEQKELSVINNFIMDNAQRYVIYKDKFDRY